MEEGLFLLTQCLIDENLPVCKDGFKSVRNETCSCQVGKAGPLAAMWVRGFLLVAQV